MQLSYYSGNNYHIYSARKNIEKSPAYPAVINLLLDNEISPDFKLQIIQKMDVSHINESWDFAKKDKDIKNIFQAILCNEGAWSDNFSQKDASYGIPAFKKQRENLDQLFLYFLEKYPANLNNESFLEYSNILTGLIVYELPLSLDYALKYLPEEEKNDFLSQTNIDFISSYRNEDKRSLYFRIFNQDKREVIETLINNGFNLNLKDHNNQNIGFYLNNKELTLFLIEKGFNLDLNHFDGKQRLKSFIKDPEQRCMDYNTQFLNFIEDKIALLPPDIEDMFKELKTSFYQDKKTLFKKKFEFFYKNTGEHLYKDISITDVIALHLIKNNSISGRNDQRTFINNFIEKEKISFPNGLENFYSSYIENSISYDKNNFKLSQNELISFIDRIKYFLSINNEHFSVDFLLQDIGTLFFNKMNFINNKSLNEMDSDRLNTLLDIMFLNTGGTYNWKDYSYIYKIIFQKLEKENINNPLIDVLTDIFINNKSFSDIQEKLITLKPEYIDFIKKEMTCVNVLVDKNTDKIALDAFLERYNILKSLKSDDDISLKNKRRL